jgi:hypothetical protein
MEPPIFLGNTGATVSLLIAFWLTFYSRRTLRLIPFLF